jgi:hypothetical protein
VAVCEDWPHPDALVHRARPQLMSPFWIWTQVAICVFVLAGMVIAVIRLF